jgi:phosphate transport system substrate-binding protein
MKPALLFIIIVLVGGISGCKKNTGNTLPDHRTILTADPYLPFMQQEVDQFMSLYPEVKVEVFGASTRGAIVSLLNDSVRSIVIDRPLNDEERQIAQQASIRIIENKIANDGVAIIVHPLNPMTNITAESLRRIISGAAKNWNQIGESLSPDGIDFVSTGRNSGMYELLQQHIFSISKPLELTAIMNTQYEVVQYVSMHPQSIGCVAASLVNGHRENVKMLPVLVKGQEGGEKEYLPGQEEVYSSLYPFHYSLYLYNTEAKAAVGVGFSAFVLSNVGQKIIQTAGITPASIPYRTIQLHAE